MAYDIITIGDNSTDIFLDMDEKSKLCGVDKKKKELRLKFMSKIPVMGVQRVIGGGNAANHAVGASRLGLKTAIYTVIGSDDAGDAFFHKMSKEGVGNKYIKCDKNFNTNLSVIVNYNEERTALSYHADRIYKLPKLDKTKWIYFSSICGNHDEFNEELIGYVKNSSVKLAFNPGSRQMMLGLERLRQVFEVCDIVFVNRDEAERLVGKTKQIKTLLKKFYSLGMKTAVITDNVKGSYCYDGSSFYKIGIIKMDVLESTGCGDAYASGFLSAIVRKKPVPEAMRWGAANSASVLGHIGSQKGLLGKPNMKKVLSKHDGFQASVL